MHNINGWNIPQQGDKFNTNWAQMYDEFLSKYATIVNSATNEIIFNLPSNSDTSFTLSGSNGNIMVVDTTNSATPTLKYYGALSATGGIWDGSYRVYSDGNKPSLSALPGQIAITQISATGSLTSATYLRGDATWATVTAIGATGALSATPSSVITITNGEDSVLGNGTGISISQATSSTDGYLTSSDWNTFNNKGSGGSIGPVANISAAPTSVISIVGGTSAVLGSGVSITINQATSSTDGYLTSSSYNTFNNKLDTSTSGQFALSAHIHSQSDITSATGWITSDLNTRELTTNKGTSGGYASLDSFGKVPTYQLPSYVEEVVECPSLSAFPNPGTASIIYLAVDTNKIYRWGGSVYVEISPSPGTTDSVTEGVVNLYFTPERASSAAPVQSVAGKTGTITLSASDINGMNAYATSAHTQTWSTITSTPITLSGYGITDAINISTSGTFALSAHYHTGEQITSGIVSNDRLVAQGTYTTTAVDYTSNVGLLMHFDGVHGSTTFTDIKGNIFTNDGNNNTYISSASYKFGGSSVYINNATIGCDTNIPLLNVGTSAFTLEFWFKKSAGCGSYAGLFSNGFAYPSDIVGVSLTPSSGIQFFYNNNIIYSNTKIFTTDVWYHFALTRKGTTLYMFINGVLDCTAINISAPINFSYQPLMGYNFVQGSGNAFVGFLDELRFTAGVCRYDNSFITQSEAFPSPGIEYLPLLQSVQLNTNGKFGGNYDLMWNNTTKRLFSTIGYDTSGSYNVNGIPHTHNGTYIPFTSAGTFALSAHQHQQSDIVSSAGWITSATTLTENVTSTVSAGAIIPGQLLTSGMSFTTFVKNLLLKTFYPSFVAPTASLASSLASSVESGTTGNVTLTVTFNRGQIVGKTNGGIWEPATFQDYRAGVATNYVINSVDMGTSASGVDVGHIIIDGSNTWTSTVSHAQGPQPVDSLGANYSTPLTSGTFSPSVTVTGKRKAFYGTDSSSAIPYTLSSQIRAISGSVLGPANGTAFTINIPIGAKMVVFAYPATYPTILRDVTSVIYVQGLMADVKNIFTQTTVSVEGASGYSVTNYKVYTYVPASPFTDVATYNVTI